MWRAYKLVNLYFAQTLVPLLQDGDIVWIHDYHLMLLPELLKNLMRKTGIHSVNIGFFLHTPFPSSEIYRALPVRKEILQGVLSSDLIAFHTYNYARHFLSCCTRISGLRTKPNSVQRQDGSFANIGIFPIGIDPKKFTLALENSAIQNDIQDFSVKFKGRKVIVGVDRLDYIKGVPQKLHAFGLFLEKYPEYRDKVFYIELLM
jgi:trehalose-6-phosphate synthase